jgi:enoyl-CoA hydratase/carnithine racemase
VNFKTVIYDKKGHIAYITLNRPERMNSHDSVMIEELPKVWQDVENDSNIWVVILTGAGEKAFCTGADAKQMAEVNATSRRPLGIEFDGNGDPVFRITQRKNNVWKPTIVAVNGVCAGGGLQFVGDGDIVICSENALFLDPHVSVGQVSALEPIRLSRKIPLEIVLRMCLTGAAEKLSAKRAYEIGLVSQVVPQSELMPTATKIAEEILQNAPLAVRGTLKAIWKGLDLPLPYALDQGWKIIMENWHTEDWAEGPIAWAEKRKPQWKAK